MNKILILLASFLIIGLIGCAGNCKTNNKLSGTLYVTGNEPFTYLALDTKDRTIYKIECSDSLKKELWQFQGQTVELKYDELKKFEKLNIAVVNGYSVKELEKNDLNKGK